MKLNQTIAALFIVTISFIVGLLFCKYTKYELIFIIFLITAYLLYQKKHALIFFNFFIFSIALIRYQQVTRPILPFENLKEVFLEGIVLEKSFSSNNISRYKTLLLIENFYYKNIKFKANFSIYIYGQEKSNYWVDDKIICGPVDIKESKDEQLFYLQKEGVAASVFCKKLNFKILNRPERSWRNWIFWQRELLQIRLFKKMDNATFSLFSSIFMGNKNSVAKKLDLYKNNFKIWGISHHLARSGLHLIIFIFIWNFILNFLPFPFLYKHIFILIITIIYALFSWTSVSFLRAIIMYFFYKLALFFEYKVKALHILIITCLLLLLYNPLYLFGLDFQLSFLLSFLLLWIDEIKYQSNLLEKTLHQKSNN